MKVRFIINPAAGGANRAAKITDAVVKNLSDAEGVFEVRVASEKGSAAKLAREAVERGFELLMACGGDGTINEVATVLLDTGTALGVVPSGSGNGFAKSLGIPSALDSAVSLVKSGHIREIDAGVICGRYFFSTAGCGFDAHLSKKYNEGKLSRKLRGLVPYFPIAVMEFFRYRSAPVVIRSGERVMHVSPFLLTVANTEMYGGGAIIAPGALPDDGLLDVCIITEAKVISAPGIVARLFSGNIDELKGFERFKADNIEIIGQASSVLHADGEPFEWKGDIAISVKPRALKVLVQDEDKDSER